MAHLHYDDDDEEEVGCSQIGFVLVVGFLIIRILFWLGVFHSSGH